MEQLVIQSFERALPPDGAKFSVDRKYRYVLWRHSDSTLPAVAYIEKLIINGIDFDERIRLAKARMHILIDRHYEHICDDPVITKRRNRFHIEYGILFYAPEYKFINLNPQA